MKQFLTYFAIQAFNYALVDASNRFIAQGNIPWSVSSGMLYAALQFLVIKKIAKEAHTHTAMLGYVTGGGLGTFLGILISRAITGQ